MFLSFRFKNFRSLRGEQQFSLVADPYSNGHESELMSVPDHRFQVLRSAAVYGANASGKSNLLVALQVFSTMVSLSQRAWVPNDPIPSYEPFSLHASSINSETEFELRFMLEKTIYKYGFAFDDARISREWLIDSTGRDRVLFERATDGDTVSLRSSKRYFASGVEARHLEAIRSQTRANSLLLSCAAQNNYKRLAGIYSWITESFFVLSPSDSKRPRFTAQLCSQAEMKARIRSLLRYADAGVSDLDIQQEEAPEQVRKMYTALVDVLRSQGLGDSLSSEIPELSRDRIILSHKGVGGNFPLLFGNESAGTRAFFYLLGPLLNELKEGTTILIDEFGASLHPNLAKEIIRMFTNPDLNPNRAQIIFATHDVSLLSLEILRRDQIWFAEKDADGASTFSRLSEYVDRENQNVASAYLNGRFGAVPFLDDGLLRYALGIGQEREFEVSDAS